MSPRRSVAEARRTRVDLLERGLAIASVDGLEGLTIGRLATAAGMSKSGVLGQFGSKENLQLAVVDTAATVFAREVTWPVTRSTPPGMPRLLALCAAWVSYLERGVFPGGCFFTAVASEFDDRGGPVRDAVAALSDMWQHALRRHVVRATEDGDLPASTDVDQVVFELTGQMLALNHALRLSRDRTAADRTRRAMSRLLGTPLPRRLRAPAAIRGKRSQSNDDRLLVIAEAGAHPATTITPAAGSTGR